MASRVFGMGERVHAGLAEACEDGVERQVLLLDCYLWKWVNSQWKERGVLTGSAYVFHDVFADAVLAWVSA
jgi:hypothetical protein